MIRAITGLDLDSEKMRVIAGRITTATRCFNLREGVRPEDDRLPKRFHTEPLPESKKIITEDQMEQLLKDYYRVRGWDENGVPPGESVSP
jgi:aldehyde:ferredoxin oxidoreductase